MYHLLTCLLYSCLAHAINLAVGDFMKTVTKTTVIETTKGIWEYDPEDAQNLVNTHSIRDPVAIVRTLAVKVNDLDGDIACNLTE